MRVQRQVWARPSEARSDILCQAELACGVQVSCADTVPWAIGNCQLIGAVGLLTLDWLLND